MNRQSKNIWWIKNPQEHTNEVKRSFREDLETLLSNCSMHCYAKIVEPGLSCGERFIWIIAHFTAFSTLAMLLVHSLDQYHKRPLETDLHDPLYPVEKISFPAVSICSNNRILKSAALDYATRLSALDLKHRPVASFMRNIHRMSALYDLDVTHLKEIVQFQNFLDKYDVNSSNSFYNTKQRMRLLTPPCTQLLLKCRKAGQMVPCLSPAMFHMSITHRGYCCLFNVNETESLISLSTRQTSNNQRSSGFDMGISILLNASTHDYFWQLFELNGFILHVFDPSKFDDVTSGVVAESFIPQAVEAFVRVSAQVMNSDDELRSYPVTTRHCVFHDEYPTKYGTQYSMSNCITFCRIRSILRLCGCVPFYMPKIMTANSKSPPYCNLHHVSCLNNFKIKWMSVLSRRDDIEEIDNDVDNSIYCPECEPPCSYTRYKISVNTLPLTRYQIKGTQIMSGVKNMSEVSLVHIYFGEPTSWYFKQSVRSPWYQILSNIGGICGVVKGFSLAAIFEALYFILSQIYYALRKYYKSSRPQKVLIIYP